MATTQPTSSLFSLSLCLYHYEKKIGHGSLACQKKGEGGEKIFLASRTDFSLRNCFPSPKNFGREREKR